jgi:RNA polymerase sigma factor (sigma-70 family)
MTSARLLGATDVTARNTDQAWDWDSIGRTVLGFARLWSRRPEDACDVAQDALLRLITKRTEVRDPIPWLFVVTRRLASKRLHSERQFPVQYLVSEPRSEPRTNRSHDLGDALRFLLRETRLGARDRRILVLVALGFTHSEIASRLGCHRRDVGQYVSRAMAHLAGEAADINRRRHSARRVNAGDLGDRVVQWRASSANSPLRLCSSLVSKAASNRSLHVEPCDVRAADDSKTEIRVHAGRARPEKEISHA